MYEVNLCHTRGNSLVQATSRAPPTVIPYFLLKRCYIYFIFAFQLIRPKLVNSS